MKQEIILKFKTVLEKLEKNASNNILNEELKKSNSLNILSQLNALCRDNDIYEQAAIDLYESIELDGNTVSKIDFSMLENYLKK